MDISNKWLGYYFNKLIWVLVGFVIGGFVAHSAKLSIDYKLLLEYVKALVGWPAVALITGMYALVHYEDVVKGFVRRLVKAALGNAVVELEPDSQVGKSSPADLPKETTISVGSVVHISHAREFKQAEAGNVSGSTPGMSGSLEGSQINKEDLSECIAEKHNLEERLNAAVQDSVAWQFMFFDFYIAPLTYQLLVYLSREGAMNDAQLRTYLSGTPDIEVHAVREALLSCGLVNLDPEGALRISPKGSDYVVTRLAGKGVRRK